MRLDLSTEVFAIITKIFKIIVIILVANGLSILVETNTKVLTFLQEKTKYGDNSKIGNFIIKILKTIIYIVAGFVIIKELGYDLSGLVAGLGLRKRCGSPCCTRFSQKHIWWCNNIY